MSSLNIKFSIHLTVKLSERKFNHEKSSWKLENKLKNALANSFYYLVQNFYFDKAIITKSVFFNV